MTVADSTTPSRPGGRRRPGVVTVNPPITGAPNVPTPPAGTPRRAPGSAPPRGGARLDPIATTPGPPAPPGTFPELSRLTAAEVSARAAMRVLFTEVFGGELAGELEKAWRKLLTGVPEDVIIEEVRQSAAHKARFPHFLEARRDGIVSNEGDFLRYERRALEIGQQYGLPAGFLDRERVGSAILSRQSIGEFEGRLQAWDVAVRAQRARPEFDAAFRTLVGDAVAGHMTDGDHLAFALDAKRALPLVQRTVQAALLGTEARESGFGALTADESFTLADRGVAADEAAQRFGALAGARQVTGRIAGETEGGLTRNEEIGVVTGDARATEAFRRRAAQRRAAFEGSSGFGAGRSGVGGFGGR